MKYYAQFLSVRKRKLIENIGSDGVFILDGRNNRRTMICDIMIQMHRLQNVATIDGYRIMKGNLKNSTCVYEWVRSGAREV